MVGVLFIYLFISFSSRQPVTKNTFRQYRVLGKGGFGEVSNSETLCSECFSPFRHCRCLKMWQRLIFINCWQFYLTPHDPAISKGRFWELFCVQLLHPQWHWGHSLNCIFLVSGSGSRGRGGADSEITIHTDKRRWERKQAEESAIIIQPISHSRFGNSSQSPACPA